MTTATQDRTHLTPETAAKYDFIIGLDASGSMATPSKRRPGKTRWQEAQETIYAIAATLGQWDEDGIDVVVFGGGVQMNEGVTAEKVSELFSRSPRGSTPLAEALQEIVNKQQRSGKNTVAIIFTDGEPDDAAAAENVIVRAANAIQEDENLSLLFVQIGDDPGATSYLTRLDNGLEGSAKFDIVAAVTAAEAENLEPMDLVLKAIND